MEKGVSPLNHAPLAILTVYTGPTNTYRQYIWKSIYFTTEQIHQKIHLIYLETCSGYAITIWEILYNIISVYSVQSACVRVSVIRKTYVRRGLGVNEFATQSYPIW